MKFYLLILICIYSFSALAIQEVTINHELPKSNIIWTNHSRNDHKNIQLLLDILSKSKVGGKLIRLAKEKARKQGADFLEVVTRGESSLTDTTLIRKFRAGTPEDVEYETKSIVYINEDLKLDEAVLDLAHELTHYIYREGFNPYQQNFTLMGFIKSTIEGKGGEAQAFFMECRVRSDLFPRSVVNSNCSNIIDDEGKYSMSLTVKSFYQLGRFYSYFKEKLGATQVGHYFPWVTDNQIHFVSSAYGMPYPVAAYTEYTSVMKKVCENDQRRIMYFKSNERHPASEVAKMTNLFSQKCKNYL